MNPAQRSLGTMQDGTAGGWRGSDFTSSQPNFQPQPMTPSVADSHQQNLSESTRAYANSARSTKERPCDACRRRKTRCVKEKGNDKCVLCKFHSQDCTYLHEPVARNRKRKAQPARTSPPKDRDNRLSTLRTNIGTGVEEYDELPGESLLKKTLGLQNKHHSRFVGVTEPFSFPRFSLPLGTCQKSTQGGIVTVRKVDNFHAFTIHEDQGTVGYETETSRIDAIQQAVEPHGQALVDLYFRIVHPSFPILHKGVFLEKYARSYREFSPALLAAVYLLATNYWQHSAVLADEPRTDAYTLWSLAIESFDLTIYRPKLSSVQAGLLIAQYECTDTDVMRRGSRGRLTAHLIAMSHTLGLHMDSSRWDLPSWEISLRCRLAWAIYMQDKWVALIEGRPPLLSDRDWIVPSVQLQDFPESQEHDEEGSSEVEKGRIIFIQMIELTKILSDMLESVFSLRSTQGIQISSDPLKTLLEQTQPLQFRLKSWLNSVTELFSSEKTTSMKLTSVGYLRLAYLAVEVSVHRRIMCCAMSVVANPQTVSVCRAAARQKWLYALEFVASLNARHLKSFWYFCSTACLTLLISFGNVMAGSSRDASEEDFYLTKLKEFRWTLKINGEMGAQFMTAAIKSMILDPKEIRMPQVPDTSSTMGVVSNLNPNLGIPPHTGFSMPDLPAQGSVGPSSVAPGWNAAAPYADSTMFTGFAPAVPMQMPYLTNYTWQTSAFYADESAEYLEHMSG